MVRRSRLGQPLMLHAIAYGRGAEFKTVPRGLKEMADVIFSSQVQSRINEKGNMVLRDAEKRGNMSSVGSDICDDHIFEYL